MSAGKTNCINVYYFIFVILKFPVINSTPTVYISWSRLWICTDSNWRQAKHSHYSELGEGEGARFSVPVHSAPSPPSHSGYRDSFPGGKAVVLGVDHPPPSLAEVKHTYSCTSTPSSVPVWYVNGVTFALQILLLFTDEFYVQQ